MVICFSIILLLIHSVIKRWYTQKIDFVLAYPQAPIEHDIYTKLKKVVDTNTGKGEAQVLKLIKNLYVKSKLGWVWN